MYLTHTPYGKYPSFFVVPNDNISVTLTNAAFFSLQTPERAGMARPWRDRICRELRVVLEHLHSVDQPRCAHQQGSQGQRHPRASR